MRNRLPILLAAALSISNLGCASSPKARAEQVRTTPDGGTVLITQGEGFQDATRAALRAMEGHCRGEYAVVEITKTGTGTSTSNGEAVSAFGVTTYSSVHSTVFGTAITYQCRKAVPQDLNQRVVAEGYLGMVCKDSKDCGGAPCILPVPDAATRYCSRMDGSFPYAVKGQECSEMPCMAGLKCSFNGPRKYCN